jgi:hypothetical protein
MQRMLMQVSSLEAVASEEWELVRAAEKEGAVIEVG